MNNGIIKLVIILAAGYVIGAMYPGAFNAAKAKVTGG